jgi:hypothetical protein
MSKYEYDKYCTNAINWDGLIGDKYARRRGFICAQPSLEIDTLAREILERILSIHTTRKLQLYYMYQANSIN